MSGSPSPSKFSLKFTFFGGLREICIKHPCTQDLSSSPIHIYYLFLYIYLVYAKTSGQCFSRALIGYSISEYPALFTDSPAVPPSERLQTILGCEQMPFRFAAVRNKEISELIKQAVSEIHDEGDVVRFDYFNR